MAPNRAGGRGGAPQAAREEPPGCQQSPQQRPRQQGAQSTPLPAVPGPVQAAGVTAHPALLLGAHDSVWKCRTGEVCSCSVYLVAPRLFQTVLTRLFPLHVRCSGAYQCCRRAACCISGPSAAGNAPGAAPLFPRRQRPAGQPRHRPGSRAPPSLGPSQPAAAPLPAPARGAAPAP